MLPGVTALKMMLANVLSRINHLRNTSLKMRDISWISLKVPVIFLIRDQARQEKQLNRQPWVAYR